MSALVHDLLTYTRAAEASPAGASYTDSLHLVRQVLANLQTALYESQAEVDLGELPRLAMEETHLLQLMQNLLSNAIKYRAPDRPLKLVITADRSDSGWTFSVRDNGIGILPEYHDRIFGLFKRLHGRAVEGTGIGLAICKRIVEHYGGIIWVESDGCSGSTFRFTVPDSCYAASESTSQDSR
jgi:light-regulated signal transduction histidine kinase (bacteriophytochrome)